MVRGIDVVTWVYVNPNLDQFWIFDYRLYAPEGPDGEGMTKPDHVRDMLDIALGTNAPSSRGHGGVLPMWAVLMDVWYAAPPFRRIEALGHVYYCPLKPNRLVG